jgi:tRNA pseudouridine55 synthase
VNGLFIIDKPGGMTSHDVVSRMRRITGERSIGHLGTLDPMATGVLPLLLGKWTRLAQFFGAAEKTYTGVIRFGFATDTYDAEGKPAGAPCPLRLSLEELRELAQRFQGTRLQTPPPYSAKKVAGRPAYELAREGKPIELKAVPVTIREFTLDSLEEDAASFHITISSGGYIRSVAHELGQIAGCGAHLAALRRTAAGPFTLSEAHPLAELEARSGQMEELEALGLHPRAILPEMPPVTADPMTLGRIRNGNQTNLPEFSNAPLVKVFASQRELAAIAKRVAGTLFQPVVVIG